MNSSDVAETEELSGPVVIHHVNIVFVFLPVFPGSVVVKVFFVCVKTVYLLYLCLNTNRHKDMDIWSILIQ